MLQQADRQATQLLVDGKGEGGSVVPMLTGIMQSISVLLELDAGIRPIAEQCRIAGIARYRLGVQLRGSHKVAGFFRAR